MPKLVEKTSKIAHLMPGTPVYTGDETAGIVKITIIEYDSENYFKKDTEDVNEIKEYKDPKTVKWINVDRLYKKDIIESIGNHFNIHPMLLEDIMDTHQRPKIEDYEDYIFMVLKMIYYEEEEEEEEEEIAIEQLSLVLGKDFVITFQEDPKDIFESVRDRILNNKGIIRKMGADYLAYSLVDCLVDSYFAIFERFGEGIEKLDKELVLNPKKGDLAILHDLKRNLVFLRRTVWPLREVISQMSIIRSPLVSKDTRMYLKDVCDHTIHVTDTIETYNDVLSGMIYMYLSCTSNRLNEIMKVLTMIATIFIPLTFLTGIYGMNFKHMPEIDSYWGYPITLFVMIFLGVSMIIYFRKKEW